MYSFLLLEAGQHAQTADMMGFIDIMGRNAELKCLLFVNLKNVKIGFMATSQ